MGINYLWDTNTAIYFLQQQFPINAEKYIDSILQTNIPVISAITEIELLCWKTASENDLKVLNNFIVFARFTRLYEQTVFSQSKVCNFNFWSFRDQLLSVFKEANHCTGNSSLLFLILS